MQVISRTAVASLTFQAPCQQKLDSDFFFFETEREAGPLVKGTNLQSSNSTVGGHMQAQAHNINHHVWCRNGYSLSVRVFETTGHRIFNHVRFFQEHDKERKKRKIKVPAYMLPQTIEPIIIFFNSRVHDTGTLAVLHRDPLCAGVGANAFVHHYWITTKQEYKIT